MTSSPRLRKKWPRRRAPPFVQASHRLRTTMMTTPPMSSTPLPTRQLPLFLILMVEDDGEGGEARAQGGQKRSADMLVEGDADGDGEGAVGTAGGEAEDLADRSRPRPRLEE